MKEAATQDGPDGAGTARLRLFAALDVPPAQARLLAQYARSLVPAGGAARLIDESTLHLTFAFLGDVSEQDVPDVARRLDEAAADVPGPSLCTATGVASFGGGSVVGVEVAPELLAILDAVRDRFLLRVCAVAPQVDRRAWRPHVSLLRVRGRGADAIVDHPDRPPVPAVAWVAPGLQLVASLPGPAGRQHRVMHESRFGPTTGGAAQPRCPGRRDRRSDPGPL